MNFSHGTGRTHIETRAAIRARDRRSARPRIGMLADLQGPKIRIGKFAEGRVMLEEGRPPFILDATANSATRARRARLQGAAETT
jgi:pyruvate kinase